jgi:hypothetical protein
LVFKSKKEYNLEENENDIRNDVLGFDENNNICIIELKFARHNKVKKQAIEFEKVVKNETEFFTNLIKLHTNLNLVETYKHYIVCGTNAVRLILNDSKDYGYANPRIKKPSLILNLW